MQRQGLPPSIVNGLRVSDAPSLDIVVAVLTGLINKELVSLLQRLGGRAIGISGIDGGLLQAQVANPELGYVGEVTRVDTGPLRAILDCGFLPLMAPLAMQEQDGSEHAPGCHRDRATVADHEVIEQSNVEQRQRGLEAPGDRLIRDARLADARGMIVRNHHR